MTGFLLKDLRDLSVMVVHAPDRDGSALVDHLRRIGCRVEAHWPPPEDIPGFVDILFVAIDRDIHRKVKHLLRRASNDGPAVIAVVDYENPATLQLVLETESLSVIGKPIRPFGLLANLVMARNVWLQRQALRRQIGKLEQKLAGQQKVAKAKSILMETQGLPERAAYESMRAQAMAKRTTMVEIANAIINANELLSFRPNRE
jgi:AmiR/NasT family two-component response regulator